MIRSTTTGIYVDELLPNLRTSVLLCTRYSRTEQLYNHSSEVKSDINLPEDITIEETINH